MKKAIVVIMVLLMLVMVSGYRIVRNTLVNAINVRLDSSEAVLLNEIDGRLYRDFHSTAKPTQIEVSPGSIQYNINGETVSIENSGKKIKMTLVYSDGTSWEGSFNGEIEVAKVDVVKIGEDIKVNLDNTTSDLFAVTYELHEDLQRSRITLNRVYTRYLAVIHE